MTYLPRDIVYDRPQVEWVWKNIHELTAGLWPDIATSGYTDMPGGKSVNPHAPFEAACLVAAEVEARAKMCGLDGFLVEERYVNGKDELDIARERHLPLSEVISRINNVLAYSASGKACRWIDTKKRQGKTYDEWKRQKVQRRKPVLRQ